jgi:asparagine synthase (glutamine-hydrolysing)
MTFFVGGFGKKANQLIKDFFDKNENLNNDTITVTSNDSLFTARAQHDNQRDAIKVGDEGLLRGKLFTKETYAPIHTFEKTIEPTILMNNYWGRYSGALYNAKTKTVSLVRDPLGLETLFYMPFEGNMLFSTKLSLLIDILKTKPSIDWDYFAEYLLEKNYLIPQTPFKGVSELLPGMHLTYNAEGKLDQTFEWQIPTETITDEKAIEDLVFTTFKKSTEAWLGNNKKITLQLSGGVDSSSILCMLKHINPELSIQALHYNDSKNVASQEIAYAQKIADECQVSLTQMDLQERKLFEPAPADWRPDKPHTGMTGSQSTKKIKDFAQNTMLFSGQGGDHVFLAPPPQESIADYWLDKGLWGISGIINELCSLFRTSWLALVKTNVIALKNYYLGQAKNKHDYIEDHQGMLSPAILERVEQKPFYLDSYLKNFSPGKAQHIKMLYHAIAYADKLDETMVTYPLLSLPVVEAGLKIPTYKSIKDGFNRYYLRKAVSRITPTQVIWRRNKGEVSASILQTMRKEFTPLVDLIMQGLLVKNGIVEKKWIEDRLNQVRHGNPRNLIVLFRIIGAELWLQQWGIK